MPRKKKSPVPDPHRSWGSWGIDFLPKRDRWRVRPPASVDPKRPATYHASRQAAEVFVAEQLALLAAPVPGPSEITLGDWFAHWLDEASVSSDWSVNTSAAYQHYLGLLAAHFTRPLAAITRADLQKRVAELLVASPRVYRRPDGTPYARPLSARTVNEAAGAWERAFEDAVLDRLIAENPTRKLRLPPRDTGAEAPSWTPAEARRLTLAARGDRFEVVLALILGCGLRIGEVLGLRWEDIDNEQRTALIHRSGTKKIVQNHAKMRRIRTVALPGPTWAALLRHHEQQCAGAEYVMERVPGRRWTYHTVRRHLLALTAAAGVPAYAFHAGRHAIATYLLASGADEADVAKLLGHASPAITRAIYSHALRDGAVLAEMASSLFEGDPGTT